MHRNKRCINLDEIRITIQINDYNISLVAQPCGKDVAYSVCSLDEDVSISCIEVFSAIIEKLFWLWDTRETLLWDNGIEIEL